MDVTAADVNVSRMSDEELANRLENLGFSPGPIVDSTRSVYQRKLLRLLNKEDMNTSDTEECQYETGDMQSTVPKISGSTIANSILIDSYNARLPVTSSNTFSAQTNSSEIASSPVFRYDELRRRPLTRTGMSWSESPTPEVRSVSENVLDKRISSQLSEPSDSSFLSFGVKLAIFVCVLLFAILLYRNMESCSSNPIPDSQ